MANERTYSVQGQVDRREFDVANNVIDVVEVSYLAANGITGRVSVPKHSYSPANVHDAIMRDLTPKLEVAKLGE